MPAVATGSLILITGVNGYVASHIAEQLLERGYRIRGTVRNLQKAEMMHSIFDGKYGAEAFEVCIVEEMSTYGAFNEILGGCGAVVHVASDLSLNPNPNIIIPMVVSGVRNLLLAAANTASIKRFVYTSSSAAATAPVTNKVFHVDVNTWNDEDVRRAWEPPPYNEDRRLAVYAASKTLAEKECWRFMREERPSFVLNAVLPNCVIGKILSKDQPASTGGWYRGMWEGDPSSLHLLMHIFPPQHYVNATDTALLHIAAVLDEDVVGERLLGFAAPFNFNDTADVLEKLDVNGCGNGERRWERLRDCPKDLKTVDTSRSVELLKRYGRPGFANLETSLRELVMSL